MRQLRTAINRFRNPPAKTAQELINDVQIAAPCPVSWGSMCGDDKVRFCGSCEKNVFDISALSADAAVELIRENQGDICIQLYRRADGTVLTEDCPKGVRRLRQAMTKKIACIVAAFGWLGFAGAANAQSQAGEEPRSENATPVRGRAVCKTTPVAAPTPESQRLGGAIAPLSVQQIVQPVAPVEAAKPADQCCPDRQLLRMLACLVAIGLGLASYKKLKGRPIWIVGGAVVLLCAVIGFAWM